MIPGLPKEVKNQEIDDREIGRIEAIIRSMTPMERANPAVIDGSRRARIATGSGVQPGDVSGLIKQFQEVKKMMQRMGNIPGLGRKMKKAKGKARAGGRVTPKGTKPGGNRPSGNKPPPFTIPGIGDDSFPGLN
jgi:signal recognition particle subunit SRP54